MRNFFAVALLLTAACGDSSGPAVIPPELAGEWVAQPACLPHCGFTVTPVANPADSLNLVQSFGLTMHLELTRAGRIQIVALGGVAVQPITGQVTVEGQTLLLRDASGTVDTVAYQLVQNRLHLDFKREVSLSGQPSTVRGVFQRR